MNDKRNNILKYSKSNFIRDQIIKRLSKDKKIENWCEILVGSPYSLVCATIVNGNFMKVEEEDTHISYLKVLNALEENKKGLNKLLLKIPNDGFTGELLVKAKNTKESNLAQLICIYDEELLLEIPYDIKWKWYSFKQKIKIDGRNQLELCFIGSDLKVSQVWLKPTKLNAWSSYSIKTIEKKDSLKYIKRSESDILDETNDFKKEYLSIFNDYDTICKKYNSYRRQRRNIDCN